MTLFWNPRFWYISMYARTVTVGPPFRSGTGMVRTGIGVIPQECGVLTWSSGLSGMSSPAHW